MGANSDRRVAFGMQVRLHRVAAGLSQEELGHRAGLHRAYIGGVERGERNLRFDTICMLADGLGVDLVTLFTPWKLAVSEPAP